MAFNCLYSRPLNRYEISLPSLFAVGGMVLAHLVPYFVPEREAVSSEVQFALIRIMAEAALVIVLFSDASLIRFSNFKVSWHLPFRLLGIGMPHSIFLSIVIGWLFMLGASWRSLLLLSAILAPTDASLAKPVVTNAIVPEPIRQTINVESGLNDGIADPIVIVAAAMVPQVINGELGSDGSASNIVQFILLHFLVAPIIGGAIGLSFAKAFNYMEDSDSENDPETTAEGWF